MIERRTARTAAMKQEGTVEVVLRTYQAHWQPQQQQEELKRKVAVIF
jgi:hypothetical protein